MGSADLVITPGPGIPRGLVIPAAELEERFARSSGPGGQGVNTTDSRVQLAFDIEASTVLSESQKRRSLSNLAARLSGTVLVVDSSEQRSQFQNRQAARTRMAGLLREALAPPPPPRRATRPTRGSVERRLAAKKRRGQLKSQRRGSVSDE